jgi:hypothetical protein
MIFIAHRGNINGVTSDENSPLQIDIALDMGFHAEVDVWVVNREIFLGHDGPEYKITEDWLYQRRKKLWIHCKNKEALEYFSFYGAKYNYFWHDKDVATLTSWGYVWVYPGNQPIKGSIAVMPEIFSETVRDCKGICSDYIRNYRERVSF